MLTNPLSYGFINKPYMHHHNIYKSHTGAGEETCCGRKLATFSPSPHKAQIPHLNPELKMGPNVGTVDILGGGGGNVELG